MLDDEFAQQTNDHINQFGHKESKVFLTKEEHDKCIQVSEEIKSKDEYCRGYQNAMVDFQRQMNLRNRTVPISSVPMKNNTEQASSSKFPNEIVNKDSNDKGKSLEQDVGKDKTKEKISEEAVQKEAPNKEDLEKNDVYEDSGKKQLACLKELNLLERFSSSASFETEIAKVNISLPSSKILKISEYRSQIGRILKFEDSSDTVNLQDDKPTIMFGPRVESSQVDDVPPFYISPRIHILFLHNVMLDSGASHNLMPKMIMDYLRLDITRPYKDLYSFDSKKVTCLGLIKDLVVSLHQMPEKTIVMDVVVADVPMKFGMLLSRSWDAKFKGTLQMDMSYDTIPVFGEQRRIYRENRLAYMISSLEYPENHPIYSVETDLGSAIFCNDVVDEHFHCEIVEKKEKEPKHVSSNEMELTEEKWCNMHFDGAVSKEGEGAGVSVAGPGFEYKSFSFKLYFECTNNVAEYEVLNLGINMIKKLEIKNVINYGDSKLVINQVKGVYQAKHPRMGAYRNIVLDLLQDIPEYQFVVVPREHNAIEDALAVSASLFKIHIHPNKKYEIEVKHRPAVPDNLKYW